ncbi:MAG: threonylcarbamoyl-AMP synthase [Bacteroidales bacterium]|nr:threonylcarbamoyl-AMP synthase [Bacteroidales bacterium]
MFREDIEKSLEILNRGGVILYPTDTVWGIGCDATNSAAVDRIYAIKRCNEARSMLILVDGLDMLAGYVKKVPGIAIQLDAEAVKPLSIIYPKAGNLASNLIANDGSTGIRMVKEPFCQQLIKTFGKPVVSTSANISGEPTPGIFDEISGEIRAAVDYIVYWRQNDRQSATASSIIKLNTDGSYNVLR